MTSYEQWKKTATGKFLKKKGLTEDELRHQYRITKRFFRDTKILR